MHPQHPDDSPLPAARDAHEASKSFVIDPTYDASGLNPRPDTLPGAAPWICGQGQVEAWTVAQLVAEGFATHKHVFYVSNYTPFQQTCHFRFPWPADAAPQSVLKVRANGTITVLIDGKKILARPASPDVQTLSLPAGPHGIAHKSTVTHARTGAGENQASPPSASRDATQEQPTGSQYTIKPASPKDGPLPRWLQITMESQTPAALLIEQGPCQTGTGWECSLDGTHWVPATIFPQIKSGLLPHERLEPTVAIKPVSRKGNVFDFGLSLLARPIFRCTGTPAIRVGESLAECLASAEVSESRMDVEPLPDGRWTSKYALGFRYLRIEAEAPADVLAEASFHPACYQGAFACSDDRLNKIWMNSATTLRLCMQRLMIDGPKRDRMPWVGDQAANLIVNAYTFAEPEIIRHSLTPLGKPTQGYVNGIVDYSLWWVISCAQYQKYFDDPIYLKQELPQVDAMLHQMAAECDGRGWLKPPDPKVWIFIDWDVNPKWEKTHLALQMLWYWALASGVALAQKAGDDAMARYWSERTTSLGNLLQSAGWNPATGAWREYLEDPESASLYPTLLAVLSGLATADQHPAILKSLSTLPHVGTPFMKGFLLMAMTQVGSPSDPVVEQIRAYWGAMLDAGAVTFWEDFKLGETDHYAMYNRPHARGLCQAWSSGPATILPLAVLGIRPLADGWKQFTIKPQLGNLQWASATVPTPAGAIKIRSDSSGTTVDIPATLTLNYQGHKYPGPQRKFFAAV